MAASTRAAPGSLPPAPSLRQRRRRAARPARRPRRRCRRRCSPRTAARRSRRRPRRSRSRTRSTRRTGSRSKPYRYGGGHRRFRDTGYDCSGAVSYALHGGGILDAPLFSSLFMRWGEAGPRAVDHRLHEPRPRLRGDRRPAVRHLRPGPARPALAPGRALEPRLHRAPPRGLLSPQSWPPARKATSAGPSPGRRSQCPFEHER